MNDPLRERALRLLARREHTRGELARKLASHANSPEQLDSLLDDLVAGALLSDQRFADARVDARAARYGNAALAEDLRRHGADRDTIDAALAELGDESVRLRTVWQKKFGVAPGDAREWARQARFLASRGFAPALIRQLLSDPPPSE